jgi:fructokinase
MHLIEIGSMTSSVPSENNLHHKQYVVAAVEGGGTTFVATISLIRNLHHYNHVNEVSETNKDLVNIPHTPFEVLHQETIPTSTPSETLENVANFFRKHAPEKGYDALGIATFGPVGVDPNNEENYGCILSGSPKKEWRNVNILSPLLEACSSHDGSHVPLFKVETDVNAPAYAEYHYHKNNTSDSDDKSISSLAYITVGTGVGVGLIVNGKPVHGMMHPEAGHCPIIPLEGDSFAYSWGAEKSPFKGKNTVEGTASSVALSERMLQLSSLIESPAMSDREGLKDLSDDDVIWDHAANALSNLCVTLALVTSVEKIVFGGGIMNRECLFDKIRYQTKDLLNGYLDLEQFTTEKGLQGYIGPSVWKEEGAGLVGALVLAKLAIEEQLESETSKNEVIPGMQNKDDRHYRSHFAISTLFVGVGSFILGLLVGKRKLGR